jgi:hypothetical protein
MQLGNSISANQPPGPQTGSAGMAMKLAHLKDADEERSKMIENLREEIPPETDVWG